MNANTETKINMREGVFAKDMKVELGREKSRKGRIRPFARGTSIKPSVLLRHRQVWSLYS
jgi:hypothetical protein